MTYDNLKASASAADPSNVLSRNMPSPRLHRWLAGRPLAGWDLSNVMDVSGHIYIYIYLRASPPAAGPFGNRQLVSSSHLSSKLGELLRLPILE